MDELELKNNEKTEKMNIELLTNNFISLLKRRPVIPTNKTVRELHEKYSLHNTNPKVFLNIVWTHSRIVADIALQITQNIEKKYNIKINKQIVEIGALLHDIGVYKCFDDKFGPIHPAIQHGIIGHDILIKEGFGEHIARFASTHTGVGLTTKNINKNNLSLPLKNTHELEPYIPLTLEEAIVCYADNFHTKIPKFIEIEKIRHTVGQHFEENISRFDYLKAKFGIPELTAIKERYEQWHKEAMRFSSKKLSN